MQRILLLVAAGLLLGADAPKDDAKKLDGTWVMVSGEEEGKKLSEDAVKKARLVMKGNEHVVHVGSDTFKGTHKVDAASKPPTIDSMDTDGRFNGKTMLGIYELDGDRFKVCFAFPGKARPKDFASGDILHVWKRQPK